MSRPKRSAARKHLDGSVCPEGTERLPSRYRACCPAFAQRTRACTFDVRYEWWRTLRHWFVVIAESAGGGGIAIAHCPHGGAKLSGGGRTGRWMET